MGIGRRIYANRVGENKSIFFSDNTIHYDGSISQSLEIRKVVKRLLKNEGIASVPLISRIYNPSGIRAELSSDVADTRMGGYDPRSFGGHEGYSVKIYVSDPTEKTDACVERVHAGMDSIARTLDAVNGIGLKKE